MGPSDTAEPCMWETNPALKRPGPLAPLDGGTRGALGTGPGSDSSASLLTPDTQTLCPALPGMLSSNFHNPPVFRVRGCPPSWLVLSPVGHRAWRAQSHNPPVLERAVESWLSRVASGSRCPTSGCPTSAQLQAGLAGHGRQGLQLMLMPVPPCPAAVHWDSSLHHPGLPAANHGPVLPGLHPGEPWGALGGTGQGALPAGLRVLTASSACQPASHGPAVPWLQAMEGMAVPDPGQCVLGPGVGRGPPWGMLREQGGQDPWWAAHGVGGLAQQEGSSP